ncbi:PKD domain-containing protein [Chryseobacterium sp. ERMR1:04]|uniref:PKD domain-containing protein n=1 Tax=Chryseobacterium sp. ERMR1:04 TaxID=1705393 RepID=UPI0034E96D9B
MSDQINNINWDFGDGKTYYGNGSLSAIYHNYKTAGTYTIKATLLLNNGSSIVKTVNITVTNTNLLKINKITIISIPQKTNNKRWVSVGTGGMWQTFTGAWDESESYGTNNMNKFADIFVYITKSSSVPDPTNPHSVTTAYPEHLFTTGINPNQLNLVFDVSANNLIMGYDALENIKFTFKDSDALNSLLEDGGADEIIDSYNSYTSQFTNTSNSVTFTQGSLSFKVDFQKL